MVTVNAVVYKDDVCFMACGYEIPQIGSGQTEEKAKKDLLNVYKKLIRLAKKTGDPLFDAGYSAEFKPRLDEIVLDDTIKPDIRKVGNLEVHFYNYK